MKAATITRSFPELVEQLGEGTLADDLAAGMKRMLADLEAVAEQSGGEAEGSIALKVKFKLDHGMVSVTGEITSKLPRYNPRMGFFWITADKALIDQNPRQPDLPLDDGPGGGKVSKLRRDMS